MNSFDAVPSKAALAALEIAKSVVPKLYKQYGRLTPRLLIAGFGKDWNVVRKHLIRTTGVGPMLRSATVRVCLGCGEKFAIKALCGVCVQDAEMVRKLDAYRGSLSSAGKGEWSDERRALAGKRVSDRIASKSPEEKAKLAAGRKKRATIQWKNRTPAERSSVGMKASKTFRSKPIKVQEERFVTGQKSANDKWWYEFGENTVRLQGSYEPLVAQHFYLSGRKIQNCNWRAFLPESQVKRTGGMSVSYINPFDGEKSRYYPDFMTLDASGVVNIIEVKSLHTLLHGKYFERNVEKFKRAMQFSKWAGIGSFTLAVLLNPKKSHKPVLIQNPTRKKLEALLRRYPDAAK